METSAVPPPPPASVQTAPSEPPPAPATAPVPVPAPSAAPAPSPAAGAPKADASSISPTEPPAPRMRPELRGVLEVGDDGKETWKGSWGMSTEVFENGGITSPFEYVRSRDFTEGAASASATGLPSPGYFDGYFMMGSARTSLPGKLAPSTTRHEERELLFRFFADGPAAGVARVEGSGSNQFGAFTLEGTLNLETRELRCVRLYTTLSKSAARVRSRARSKGKGKRNPVDASLAPPAAAANRPGRIRKVPAHLLDSVTAKANDPLTRMGAIVEALKSADKSSFFCQPVDTSIVRDYLSIIAKPMDLGTVERKIAAGEYTTPEEAAADVELIFNNAMHYNQRGTVFYTEAAALMSMFQARYRDQYPPKRKLANGGGAASGLRISADVAGYGKRQRVPKAQYDPGEELGSPRSRKRQGPGRPRATGRGGGGSRGRGKGRGGGGGGGGGNDRSEIAALRRQLSALQDSISSFTSQQQLGMGGSFGGMQAWAASPTREIVAPSRGRSGGGGGRRGAGSAVLDLSFEEKKQLGEDIHRLDSNRIHDVIAIIEQCGAQLPQVKTNDEGEVELDFDQLPTHCLRRLQEFVRSGGSMNMMF